LLVEIKLPRGEIRATQELEELSVAQKFGVLPNVWDELVVDERTRLIAAARDQGDLEYISSLPKEERDNLRGSSEWVVLD